MYRKEHLYQYVRLEMQRAAHPASVSIVYPAHPAMLRVRA
jgi:hypothetical protein